MTSDGLLVMHQEAQRLFLAQRPASWVPAYLAGRGFPSPVQAHWQIGYAPKSWRVLTDHLRTRGFSEGEILQSGLARRARSSGRLYDTFRDRAIFPIRDSSGAICGFIGRAAAHSGGPKYLNSPETPLFHKGRLLYGLYEAPATARPVIVEGPLDAIAVQLAGFAGVSPCGTALTVRQAELLGPSVLVALDGDASGRRGAVHAWQALSRLDGPIGAVALEEGQDPAEILHRHGHMAVREMLESEVPLADLVVDAAIERHGRTPGFIEDRLSAARAAARVIAHMRPANVARQVVRAADALGLEHSHLTQYVIEAVSPDNTAEFPLPPSPTPRAEPRALRYPRDRHTPRSL